MTNHAPISSSFSSSDSDEEVHVHCAFEHVKAPKRCCTESENVKKSLKASRDKLEAKHYEHESNHTVKGMEFSKVKTTKNETVKEMKDVNCKLAISQAEKANFKADLSFCKRKVEDFESS